MQKYIQKLIWDVSQIKWVSSSQWSCVALLLVMCSGIEAWASSIYLLWLSTVGETQREFSTKKTRTSVLCCLQMILRAHFKLHFKLYYVLQIQHDCAGLGSGKWVSFCCFAVSFFVYIRNQQCTKHTSCRLHIFARTEFHFHWLKWQIELFVVSMLSASWCQPKVVC